MDNQHGLSTCLLHYLQQTWKGWTRLIGKCRVEDGGWRTHKRKDFSLHFASWSFFSRHSSFPCLNSDIISRPCQKRTRKKVDSISSSLTMRKYFTVYFLFLLPPQLRWAGGFSYFTNNKNLCDCLTGQKASEPGLLKECKTEKQCSMIIKYTAFQKFALASLLAVA